MNIVIFVLESRLSKKIKNDVNLLERVFFQCIFRSFSLLYFSKSLFTKLVCH